MNLVRSKNQTPKKILKLTLLAGLFCVFATVFAGAKALAAPCYVDPDYQAAGSITPPSTGCLDQPNYVFTGDSNSTDPNPVIIYSVSAADGTNSNVLATMYLQDANADPLIWRGTTTYGNHAAIAISINRADFNAGGNIPVTRYDGGPPPIANPNTITIPVNDVMIQFAQAHSIAIQLTNTSSCPAGSEISAATGTCVPADICSSATTGSTQTAGCGNTFVTDYID